MFTHSGLQTNYLLIPFGARAIFSFNNVHNGLILPRLWTTIPHVHLFILVLNTWSLRDLEVCACVCECVLVHEVGWGTGWNLRVPVSAACLGNDQPGLEIHSSGTPSEPVTRDPHASLSLTTALCATLNDITGLSGKNTTLSWIPGLYLSLSSTIHWISYHSGTKKVHSLCKHHDHFCSSLNLFVPEEARPGCSGLWDWSYDCCEPLLEMNLGLLQEQ